MGKIKEIELPDRFKTWAEFYNCLEEEGLTNRAAIFVLPKQEGPSPSHLPEIVQPMNYNMNEIKEMTFNELWEERKTYHGLNRKDLECIIECLEGGITNWSPTSVGVLRKIEIALNKIDGYEAE